MDTRGLTVPEGDFDFANLRCGKTGRIVIPLTNDGITPMSFTASTTLHGITITPSEGSIEPGQRLDLSLETAAIEQSIPGVPVEGTLRVSTHVGDIERTLRLTTIGGVAEVTPVLDFGETSVGQAQTRSLVVSNTGNAPFGVTIGLGGDSFTMPGLVSDIEIGPMSSQEFPIEFAPTTIRAWNGEAILSYDRTLCQPGPASVGLSGAGSGSPLLASFTAMDFGTARCGGSPVTMAVTLTNNLAIAQALTASIEGTNAADFTVSPSATVPAGGTATISVTRQATADQALPGPREATLRIEAIDSGGGVVTKLIPLSYRIDGTYLHIVNLAHPVTIHAQGFGAKTIALELVNDGNEIAAVGATLATVPAAVSSTLSLSVPLQVPPRESRPLMMTVQGDRNETFQGVFSLYSNDLAGTNPGSNWCSPRFVIDVAASVTVAEMMPPDEI